MPAPQPEARNSDSRWRAKFASAAPRRLAIVAALFALCVACTSQTPTTIPAPLPVTSTPSPAGFYVDAARTLGVRSPLALGTNHGPWAFVNAEVMPQFKASGLGLIRFPGGNWGDDNNLEAWQVDYFMTLVREISATPLISVRLRGGTAAQAVALLQYMQSKNYNVRYWSIGNEPSLYPDYDTERFNSEWRAFAQALKAADPNIVLVGPDIHQFTGEPTGDPKDKLGRDWLREFLKANGDLVDVVAVHRYPFPKQRGDGAPSLDALLSDPPNWERLVANLRAVVRETTGKDKPIAITEFNSSWVGSVGRDPATDTTLDSFNNALWLGDVLGRLIRARVDMLAQFSLMSGSNIGGFGLFDRFDVRPSYYTYVMWKDFGGELVHAQSDEPKLSLYAARSGETLTLMFINLSARAITRPLFIDHFERSGMVQVKLFDSEHHATMQPAIESVTDYTAPPYSMTLLTFAGKVNTMVSPTTTSRPAPAALNIPGAAWSRGIGLPYDKPIRKHVSDDTPMIDDGAWSGLPLGGLGAGAIGRTHRGDFARWHLDVGTHQFQSLPANQFSVFVQQGAHKQAHVLAPLRPDSLHEWNWDMPIGAGTYYALFPKAWFVYDWDVLPVRLSQKQFSPVIPHNYRESSYPVGVFEWRLENPTDAPLTVGIMFTWQNLLGHFADHEDLRGGNYNFAATDGATGVVLTRRFDRPMRPTDGSFAIATPQQPGVTATYRTRFLLADGRAVWNDFAEDGRLDNLDDTRPADEWDIVVAALAVTVELAPHEVRSVPMALAWDLPIMQFGSGAQWYKRYTKFYGTSGRSAWQIAKDALAHYQDWEAQIDAWQAPILNDTSKPDWYKSALFNELYYMVDGGTAWEHGTPTAPARNSAADEIGHFAVLECYDYPFYNTFDVDFYASFARAQLWPELEKSVIRDFVATVPISDPSVVEIQATKQQAVRKVAGAVPHDLGGPPDDPWRRVNYYRWQDINIWKDLNSKFVLQVWRDYVMLHDRALVHEAWPAIVQALAYLQTFDRDGDGLLDHDNVPDQTYDTWNMSGASAYGGSLWLAALNAAREMAQLEGDTAHAAQYTEWLRRGQQAFEAKLWNGRYYIYDASGGTHSDSIMADQLAGQWYADATGLPAIAPPEHVATALRTIFDYNVARFAQGQMGAINGMRPDGQVDLSSEQSQEVWTGTTYALAAFMIHRGMRDEAFATAYGVYHVTYHRGYWFRTPEAYVENGNFRASMYLRPLAIWAMEYALQHKQP